MLGSIFSLSGVLIPLGFAVAGFLISLIFRDQLGDKNKSWNASLLRGLEAAVLAVLGGLISRAFIELLLGSAHDSTGAELVVGWGFFLIPGIVDTIPVLLHSSQILTTPDALLMFATIVGGFSGMMSGIWRIYDWEGLGWLSFPLDVTWALAGNTVSCLLHVINFAWGNHGAETRTNAHRYASGFGLMPTYAFTQGSVMSNLPNGPGDNLYSHEYTHVWQNRCFGAMYTLTYLAWMLVWLIPGLIAGAIVDGFSGAFHGIMDWCYFNNPWETWGYKVQGADRKAFESVKRKSLVWSPGVVLGFSIPFFLLVTPLAVFLVVSAWRQPVIQTPPPAPTHHPRPGGQGKSPGQGKPPNGRPTTPVKKRP